MGPTENGLKKSDVTLIASVEEDASETLAEHLKRGPLSVAESLRLGIQIAEELGDAHENGTVHGNLDASNIRLTADGQSTIIAFDAADDKPATGGDVDRVEDSWTFGSLLFQMLTGQPPLSGQTDSDPLTSSLSSEPDWSLLPSELDPRVRFVLERCLDQNAASRCSNLKAVAADLGKALAGPEGALVSGKARWIPWAAALVVTALLAGLVGWTFATDEDSTVVRFEVASATPVELSPPLENIPEAAVALAIMPELGISADGSRVVFRGVDGAFYIRDRRDAAARRLEFTEQTNDLWEPLFSPDGQDLFYVDTTTALLGVGADQEIPEILRGPLTVAARIAATADSVNLAQAGLNVNEFADEVTLRRVSANGGSTTLISSWPENVIDLTWGANDELLFADQDGSVLTVPATGGSPFPMLDTVGARYPQRLPDNDRILYSAGPQFATVLDNVTAAFGQSVQASRIVVQSVADPEDLSVIWEGGTRARFVPETGDIVYVGTTEPGLWAFPFDPERLAKTGDPVPMVDGLVVDFDVSASGALVYALVTGISSGGVQEAAEPNANNTLGVFDLSGELVRRLRVNPGSYFNPRVSPDGSRIAYEYRNAAGNHIWIYDLVSNLPRQLTTEGTNMHPVWKDDNTLTFASRGAETWGMYSQSLEGGEAELLAAAPGDQFYRPQAWSPDGTLVFVEGGGGTRTGQLMMLSPESEITEIPPAEPGTSEFGATLSADGRILVYIATGCLIGCVRAAPFPPVRGSSFEVAQSVAWAAFSPDGSELFLGPSTEALAVRDVIPGTIDFGDARIIEFGNPLSPLGNRAFDIGLSDGEPFVVGVLAPNLAAAPSSDPDGQAVPVEPVSVQIDYIHNFFELLEQRVR